MIKIEDCPLEKAVKTISGTWKIPIIWHIRRGQLRPSELLRAIEGIDRRVLNHQLAQLIGDGLLAKETYAEVPPRVEYRLTARGEELFSILLKLHDWGEQLD